MSKQRVNGGRRYAIPARVLLLVALTPWLGHAEGPGSASVDPDASWPTFRGKDRTGVSADQGLLSEWPEGGPPLVWEADGAGRGYASVAIDGGRLYTMGDRSSLAEDEDEYLVCFAVADGRPLWKAHLGTAWDRGSSDLQGSRSTPTVDGQRVYVLTPHGDLVCVSATDGTPRWRRNLIQDFDGKKGDGWGYSESVWISGDRVICTPGGEANTMVALDKGSGELLWSASRPGDRGAGHASVVSSQIGGVEVLVQTTASGALGVGAQDGALQWSYEIEPTTAVIPSPIVRGDLAFFAAGYGLGGALLRQVVTQDGRVDVEEIYPVQSHLQNKHGGIILVGGHLYGDSGDSGTLFCADLLTGERLWRSRGSGRGSAAVTAADGKLYLRFADGLVVLADATPEGYHEISSFRPADVGDRPAWAHPVVVGGRLYLRHDDRLWCYDLRPSG